MKSEQLISLIKDAEALALRWVKAWDGGYSSINNLNIDLYNNRISFVANTLSSGLGLRTFIDISYLDNDFDLEKDARAWYKSFLKENQERANRIQYLEGVKEIQEYKILNNNPFIYHNIPFIH